MNKNTGISGEKIHLTNEDIDIVQMVIDIWKLKIWIIKKLTNNGQLPYQKKYCNKA